MEYTRNDIEIMSPVGSFETLMAAIQGGADSVYFGIGRCNNPGTWGKNLHDNQHGYL